MISRIMLRRNYITIPYITVDFNILNDEYYFSTFTFPSLWVVLLEMRYIFITHFKKSVNLNIANFFSRVATFRLRDIENLVNNGFTWYLNGRIYVEQSTFRPYGLWPRDLWSSNVFSPKDPSCSAFVCISFVKSALPRSVSQNSLGMDEFFFLVGHYER